jgi:FKBP-type peptidyl-prolyl cis-trans isomerase
MYNFLVLADNLTRQRELVNNKVMKRHVKNLMFGILSGLLLISCNDGADVPNELDQWVKDVEAIDDYLEAQGIEAIEDPSGMRIVIATMGDGLPAQPHNGVDVDYVGKRFEDKFVFDQGTARNSLANLIDGWREAFTRIPAGSEATLYIPSLLGYKSTGSGADIPPNTILEFDVVFNEVVQSTADIQRFQTDTTTIDQYLSVKGINAIQDPTGLRYVITQLGTGPTPTWYDQVKFNADFKLLSNDTQSIADITFEPSQNNFNRVIDQTPHGFKTALQKLPAGSKATLYIASGLGYGPQGASNGSAEVIPANSNIIVELELTEIISN